MDFNIEDWTNCHPEILKYRRHYISEFSKCPAIHDSVLPCHRGSVSPRSRAPKLPCLFVPPCSHATVLPFPSVLPCPRSLVPTFPRAFMVPCLLVPSCSRTAVLPCFRASVSTHLFRFSTFEIFKCPNFEYLGVGMPVQRIFGSSEVP